MKHHEMMLITEFRLHMAPIPENAEKILDLGTGTGQCDRIVVEETSDNLPCIY